MSDEAIFAAAQQLDNADARSAYLKAACGDDLQQKLRIEALLAADQQRDSLLDVPFFDGSTERYVTSNVTPGDSIGPYKLLQRIGEGGFGVVFMAEQQRPVQRRVALKIIKPGMDSRQVIARFEAERQALAIMDHPNIAKVLDAGTAGFVVPPSGGEESSEDRLKAELRTGRPFFVMELVCGVAITEYADKNSLSARERLALFISACRAVQHAHQKGVIHRDIKPSNVMVTLHDGEPVVKVIDFGVSKALHQKLTERTLFTAYGEMVGTPQYMSPEQAEMSGLDVDTRSDVYSLGVLLYELLTGTTPLESHRLREAGYAEIQRLIQQEDTPRPSARLSTLGDRLTIVAKHRSVAPERLSQLLRGDLDWIVMKALEKERSRRYETASSLAADIEAHLRGRPVSAAAPSRMYRVRKYVRRHKAALAVAATILGLLVTGTVVSSALAVRAVRATSNERAQRIVAERNERQAEQERNKAADAQRRAERLAYSAGMSLASSDWEDGNLVRLEQTLEATASYPDLGFEWYHWHDQLHQDLRTINLPLPGMALSNVYGIKADAYGGMPLRGMALSNVYGMTAAAHGRMIIINSSNGTYVMDADSENIRAAYGFSVVSGDGRWLATAATSGLLYTLIDTSTGMRRPVRLPERLNFRAISPDATLIAAWRSPHQLGEWDESVLRVWDTKTTKPAYDISVAPQNFSDVYFSPDGHWIAGGVFGSDAGEQQFKLWRASDGEEVRAIKSVDFGFLRGFTPNSKYVVRIDSRDGPSRQIYLHNTANLADVKRIPVENMAYIRVAFSPDSQYLATATDEGMIAIKDIENGRTLATYRGHRSDVQAVAFSHDGGQVITYSLDGSLKFWPVDDHNYIRTDAGVIGTWLSTDGTRLLAQTVDAPTGAQLIDVASKRILQTYRDVYISNIFPDGKRVVTAPYPRDAATTTPVTIADDTGKALKTFACDPYLHRLSVSPDGRRILVASNTSFSLLDADSGKVIIRRPQNGQELWSTAFSPDGKRLALSFLDEDRIVICDAETGRMVDSVPLDPDAKEGSRCADYSRDGRQILVAYRSPDFMTHGVSIYDVATKKRIQRIVGHVGEITAASFFPDGRRIITASEDGSVRLWDVENGFELFSLRADENIAVAVASSGRTFAIPGRNGIFLAKAATPEQVSAWRTVATQPRDDQWWRRQGGVQDWLVLAPIAVPLSDNFEGDLDREQLAGESNLDPRPGDDVRLGDQELTWRQVSIGDWALNFDTIVGPGHDYCLGYAVAHIHSDKARDAVRLLVGSDDLAKIYLNGEVVYEFRHGRPMFPGDDEALVNLRKGKNVLVFKVIDIVGNWGATAQLVGEDYQPIPGITTGIRP